MRTLGIFGLGLLLAAVPLLAAGPWETKQFPKWDRQLVLRVLTESPWAKSTSQTVNFERAGPQRPVTWKDLGVPGDGGSGVMNTGSPVGGIGKPKSKEQIQVSINVRWSSALPVKQATALTKYGREGLDLPEARQIIDRDDAFYVLEVTGIPPGMAYQGIETLQDHLFRTVRLVTASGRSIPADSVYVTSRGSGLAIAFRFPKSEPITLKDKELTFFMKYDVLKVERKYKLKQMVYNGKLEL